MGVGIIGSCEDQDEDDVRGQFSTNVMGTVNIIKAALPHFKERKRGRYIIFSSIAGALGMPGLGRKSGGSFYWRTLTCDSVQCHEMGGGGTGGESHV
jgi:NAD(P)-dependent dehydrogenase (short-subunit alcohol dehydrogenase family)